MAAADRIPLLMRTEMNDNSPLARLFGAYLNQDVFDLYADEFDGAADFASDVPDEAAAAADEIDRILSSNADDAAIQRALAGLAVEIEPVGLTYREWLTRIAARLRTAT
jgi:contact-dependent growth inhibition (CDI) system CdiI-like immunity protein